jgi:putative membrane protein
MKKFFLSWLVHTVALLIVARVVAGIIIENWTSAVVAALVLGILNAFLRPLLIVVTLPLTVLSLGLFTFIINAFMFTIAARLVQGFTIANFWSAFWGALLFSLISLILNLFISPAGRFQAGVHRGERSGATRSRGKVIEADVVPPKDKDRDKDHGRFLKG